MKKRCKKLIAVLAAVITAFLCMGITSFADTDLSGLSGYEAYKNYVLQNQGFETQFGHAVNADDLRYLLVDLTNDGEGVLLVGYRGDEINPDGGIAMFVADEGGTVRCASTYISTEQGESAVDQNFVICKGDKYYLGMDYTDQNDVHYKLLGTVTHISGTDYTGDLLCGSADYYGNYTINVVEGQENQGQSVNKETYDAYNEDMFTRRVDFDEWLTLDEFIGKQEEEYPTSQLEFYSQKRIYDSGWTYLFRIKNETDKVSKGYYVLITEESSYDYYYVGEKLEYDYYRVAGGYALLYYELQPYEEKKGSFTSEGADGDVIWLQDDLKWNFEHVEQAYKDYELQTDTIIQLKFNYSEDVEAFVNELEENGIYTGYKDGKFTEHKTANMTVEEAKKSSAWLENFKAQYAK